MKSSINTLLFISFFNVFLCDSLLGATGNSFLVAAQDQIDKISQKPVHKSHFEFKQAVAHYIKYTDVHYLQSHLRHADENIAYKKELRYLFKNHTNISSLALLSRIRSAHQAMVIHESGVDSEVYQRYEQISSALLLSCAQIFF